MVARALLAGKGGCCPPPAAASLAELERIQSFLDGRSHLLLAPGDLRRTVPGAHAMDLVGRGGLGDLHAVYGAVRRPQRVDPGAADVVQALGSDLFDFVLAVVPAPIRRVYAVAGNLFGASVQRDTATIIVRFMLEELWDALQGKPPRADSLGPQRRLLELLEAVDRSIARGEAIALPA